MTRYNRFALGFVAALCSQVAAAAEVLVARPELVPAPAALAQQVQVLQQQLQVVQQQLQVLQQQDAQLQSQLAAVLAAVHVTPAGFTLQGPTVTIAGNVIDVNAQSDLRLSSNAASTFRTSTSLAVQAGADATLMIGRNFMARSSGTAILQSSGELDLSGSTIKLNGGRKSLATVGSQVQGVTAGSSVAGQIVTGSPDVLVD